MSEGRTILCVDDDSTVLRALRTVLANGLGAGVDVELAESGDEALEIVDDLQAQGRELALVISDYVMPGLRGDELLVRVHARCPRALKVLLTGQSDLGGVKRAINEAELYRFIEKPFQNEDIVLTARSALRAHAQERDLMRQNEELRRINAELESIVAERTRELVAKNAELEVLSVTDRLTGLFNRRKLDAVLDEEVALTRRYGSGFAVVLIDIDHFKQINDTWGHAAGDEVLVALAQLLRECTRAVDAVARYGGEEFVIVCRHPQPGSCRTVADKLRQRIAAHVFPHVGHLTASFGIAAYKPDEDVATLLGRADAALYRAKKGGRDRVEFAA